MNYRLLKRLAMTTRSFLGGLFSNRKFALGITMLMVSILASVMGGRLLPHEFLRAGYFPPGKPPSLERLLGTDSLGRDMLTQLFIAIPSSLLIGLIAATAGTILGTAVGFIGGYYGGVIDDTLRVPIDVFLSIPSLIFLVLIASLVKAVNVWAMAMLISIFSWAWPARQTRAQMLSLKERDFVYTARLSGMGSIGIIVGELMPHMFQWMGANFTNAVLSAILTESGLSIIGCGPQGEITLGMMLYWALSYAALFRGLWWWWMTPTFTLIFLFASLCLIHLGLDEIFNPRLRGRGS